ncbi:MAG: hypothetical protein A2W35_16165 [Chloroflexi bacterium RBG_16_57_11]|nr:MAG: hypothetical protein A2W35_16165 [Chloroflexi bacterium RBG_16_57_11]
MISLELAHQLKGAGLHWQPALNDFFAIPDRGMDELVFVISDLLATLETLHSQEIVAFQGASEWALDDLATGELVWLPREDQVRQALEAALWDRGCQALRLDSDPEGDRCSFELQNQAFTFRAVPADEAYADALLHLLKL